ncbi:MAG: hypothetical protein O7G88_09825 [bacterium]|nr:hypothetical protein [bacterium]
MTLSIVNGGFLGNFILTPNFFNCNANREWAWQLVFPTAKRSRDPYSGGGTRIMLIETGNVLVLWCMR